MMPTVGVADPLLQSFYPPELPPVSPADTACSGLR